MKNLTEESLFHRFAKRVNLIALFSLFALTGNAYAALTVTSNTFSNNGRIPDSMTFSFGAQCHGPNLSPELSWTAGPTGTLSYAVVAIDPDGGNWLHWGIFNIPDSVTNLPANVGTGVYTDMTNDFGAPGYGGPCPPSGTGDHHYIFTVYALNVSSLPPNASVTDIQGAAIDEGTITGLRKFGEYASSSTSKSVPSLSGFGLAALVSATVGCAFWMRRRRTA